MTIAAMRLPELATAILRDHDAVATDVNAATAAANSALGHARRAGELLIEAKSQLSHGDWLPWLAENCPTISARTAQGYMRIALKWSELSADPQRVAHLPLREALRLLATPRDDGRSDEAPRSFEEEVPIESVAIVDEGWTLASDEGRSRLMASLRGFGQLNPLLVRPGASPGAYDVIDGRQRLRAMQALDYATVLVRCLGSVSALEASGAAMAVMLRDETDFPALARVVADVSGEHQCALERLAEAGPFTVENLSHFLTFLKWDWSIYSKNRTEQPSTDSDAPQPSSEDVEEDFRCPCCGYEWSGKPRIWKAGGRARADASDRYRGITRIKLIATMAEGRSFRRQVRELLATYGTENTDQTVLEAVRRAHAALTASPEADGS